MKTYTFPTVGWDGWFDDSLSKACTLKMNLKHELR